MSWAIETIWFILNLKCSKSSLYTSLWCNEATKSCHFLSIFIGSKMKQKIMDKKIILKW